MRLAIVVTCLCLLPEIVRAAAPVVPTLPPSALRAGQRALVRTVFTGDSVETFEAEIIGVLPGGRAEGDLILARATGPRVQSTGVAQGMSGSPVYVDGKLIGALSSGWGFSKEPVFGITPIAEMLAVLDAPESAVTDGTGGPAGVAPMQGREARFREFHYGEPDASSDGVSGPANPAARPSTVTSRPGALAIPLAASGLNPAALAGVCAMFEPLGLAVVPGGRQRGTPPARALEPGSAIAVDVLRGDLNFSAIGTVTYVDRDRVLIFGHPFFQSGEVRMPLSRARIATILASLNTSFKLGVAGEPIGTATQDRRAAVAGRLGAAPSLMPLAITVRGARSSPQHFRFEAIEDRSLLPQLVSAAVLNSLLESGGAGAMQTISWSLAVWSRGQRLLVSDLAAGDAPLGDVALTIGGPLRFLTGNPFRRFHADSVVVELETRPGRASATLRSATLDRISVRPGGVARVTAEVERWRGARESLKLDVPVPDELPDGRYVLVLAGGPESDRFLAARLPARFRAVSLEDAWQRLGSVRRSDALYAGLWAKAPEVSFDGEDLPELPTSALAILASPQRSGDRARRGSWALLQEAHAPFGGVLRGELLLELMVDRQGP